MHIISIETCLKKKKQKENMGRIGIETWKKIQAKISIFVEYKNELL